jgi:hypothetical protein
MLIVSRGVRSVTNIKCLTQRYLSCLVKVFFFGGGVVIEYLLWFLTLTQ